MTDRCIGFEELDRILRGGISATAQEHLESCPRCRSRLVLYRSYVDVQGKPADSSESAAAAQLQEALESEILGSTIGTETETSAVGWLEWLRGLVQPIRFAPTLGFVSLLIAAVLLLRTWQPWTADRITLREGRDVATARTVELIQPIATSKDKLELRWRSVRGADAYRVRLLSARLEGIACIEAGRDTVLVLHASSIQPSTGTPPASLWLVEAFESGDRIAESAPSVLPSLQP